MNGYAEEKDLASQTPKVESPDHGLFTESKAYLNLIVDFIILVLTLLYLVDRIFFL